MSGEENSFDSPIEKILSSQTRAPSKTSSKKSFLQQEEPLSEEKSKEEICTLAAKIDQLVPRTHNKHSVAPRGNLRVDDGRALLGISLSIQDNIQIIRRGEGKNSAFYAAVTNSFVASSLKKHFIKELMSLIFKYLSLNYGQEELEQDVSYLRDIGFTAADSFLSSGIYPNQKHSPVQKQLLFEPADSSLSVHGERFTKSTRLIFNSKEARDRYFNQLRDLFKNSAIEADQYKIKRIRLKNKKFVIIVRAEHYFFNNLILHDVDPRLIGASNLFCFPPPPDDQHKDGPGSSSASAYEFDRQKRISEKAAPTSESKPKIISLSEKNREEEERDLLEDTQAQKLLSQIKRDSEKQENPMIQAIINHLNLKKKEMEGKDMQDLIFNILCELQGVILNFLGENIASSSKAVFDNIVNEFKIDKQKIKELELSYDLTVFPEDAILLPDIFSQDKELCKLYGEFFKNKMVQPV